MKTITLSVPPSVNEMYRHKGHITYKTKKAKDWIKESLKKIRKRKPITGQVDVSVNFYFKRERDIDNSLKALLDVIQEAGVIENDRQVYSLVVTKDFDKENPRVEVDVMNN